MRFVLSFLLVLPVAAAAKSTVKSAGHHAHVHGHADLNIAFDSDHNGVAQMVVPAESLWGFEHEPTNVTETKAKADGLDKLAKKINDALIFDSSLKCIVQKTKIAVVAEKDEPGHQEVHADFDITCVKSVSGTTLKFGFTSVFSRLKEVRGQLLTPAGAQAIDVDDDHGSYEL